MGRREIIVHSVLNLPGEGAVPFTFLRRTILLAVTAQISLFPPVLQSLSCFISFLCLCTLSKGSPCDRIGMLEFPLSSRPLWPRYGMSQQRLVFPFPGFGEAGLPICSGPRMAAKSWLPLLQLSFGEWEEARGRGRARMT